jgi:hypothetical protein
MSKSIWDHPEITTDLIEKSMRQARVERSKVVWGLLQNLFSRPESREAELTDFSLQQRKLRLG